MADLWKDFWTRETGTGQQVAQLHDRYMMMMKLLFVLALSDKRPEFQLSFSNIYRCWMLYTHARTYMDMESVHFVYALRIILITYHSQVYFNPLNPELNPICYLLALLGAHHFLHVSRIRVKLLTLRLLMSYIYGAPNLDVSRSHTTTQHSR